MSTQASGPEYYIGLMSGTSVDAIDCALIDTANNNVQLRCASAFPIPDKLISDIHQLCAEGQSAKLHDIATADIALGQLMADAVQNLLSEYQIEARTISAIGSHGQTIYHHPHGNHPYSLQIGDPNIIAERSGITTVADFRRRDLAAGGEGAPLVPLFHKEIFHSDTENRVILNIGGIANITVLPADISKPVTGFDTGPGNTLMDQWMLKNFNKPMDTNGEIARQGKVDASLLQAFLQDSYFSRPAPKSSGREYFNPEWLASHINSNNISIEDVQATLCMLTATSIINAINEYAADTNLILVCGGGCHNPALMTQLRNLAQGMHIEDTNSENINPDWVEAMTFAWLAKNTIHGKAGNLPSVTGARSATILGGIYTASGSGLPIA